jgi:phosphoglycerol transferase MdoB-like AlkP superfamily enzyme
MRRTWSTATHSNYAQMAVLSSLFPRRGRSLDTYQQLDYPRFLLHDAFHRLGYSTATISSQDESWQGMNRFQATGTPTHFQDARNHHGPRLDIGSERIVPDAETTSKALDWLAQRDPPWALYLNYQSTHFPYRLPPDVARPFQPDTPLPSTFDYLRYPEQDRPAAINRYKNALSYVDTQIGRLAEALRDAGQLDNTLWVITSDHGELFHEHGLVTHGRTLFEGEARVPLVLHWPAGIGSGVSDIPVSTLDVLPTILHSAGLAPHPSHQGSSFLSRGSPVDTRQAVLLNIQGLRSVEGVVCWPLKLVRDVASGGAKLFDLHSDPEETVDLSETHVEQRRQLLGLLRGVMNDQDGYHRNNEGLATRFAPRIPRCPE